MSIVKILRSTVTGHVPAALVSGQIAINEADGVLFWRDGAGTVKSLNLLSLVSTTAAPGDNSTKVATTAFVKVALDGLLNGAPGALDTLKELADAIGDDANFAATVTAALANRLRVDAVQSLSPAQKAQAQANLGLAALALLEKIQFADIDAAAVATQVEATAGTANNKLMTPLRVAQAVSESVSQALSAGGLVFKSNATGDDARSTGFKIADGTDIGELNRNNQYVDDRVNNCSGYLPNGNCTGNPQWTPPNGNWWTWGLGFTPGNPNGYDFGGGSVVTNQTVTVGFVYGSYNLTADEIGGGEYHRTYNNCNCGAFNCYSNCNCNCACACNCDCGGGG
jgi:hypothetical protein